MSEHYYQERQTRSLKSKILRNIAGGAIILAVIAAILFPALYFSGALANTPIAKDSGVSACEKMAENAGKKNVKGGGGKWGEPEYRAARMPFESSEHADIKVAGGNMVDTIYNLEKQGDNEDDLGGALVTLSTIQTQWAALQTACANHGVDVPALPTA
jgi:hypothetical protein